MENIITQQITVDDFINRVADSVTKKLEKQIQQNEEQEKKLAEKTDRLLKSREAAQLLGVSLVTLHKWKMDGTVKFHRVGSQIRFKHSEVLNALNSPLIGRAKR